MTNLRRFILVLTLPLGCASGVEGDGSSSSDEVGDTADEGPVCEPLGCSDPADCCVPFYENFVIDDAFLGGLAHFECGESAPYPNRWTCDEGSCKNLGCDGDAECPAGWICADVNSVDTCIQTCGDTEDCDVLNGTDTTDCTGDATHSVQGAVNFCEQI